MSDEPRLTPLGTSVILLFILGCSYGAYLLFSGGKPSAAPVPGASQVEPGSKAPAAMVEIGIASGTEKKNWMLWAIEQFAATENGKRIKVNLLPMGSIESSQAILAANPKIQVWSPASSLYEDVFVQEWKLKYNKSPILRKEVLALSPMVFVMWAERYEAFLGKYKELNFTTLGQALSDPAGWDGIAKKPEWGIFKFGHAHPGQSNSGLQTLVLMACDHHKKSRNLTLKDILNPGFQDWMNGIESATSGMSNSTGNMMRDMVLRGPSSYDALFVYESVVIDYLKSAEGRWGELHLAYPPQNAWNDNPYYVLDTAVSTPEQQRAAGEFLDFLLSEPVQRESLKHGFRPGNPSVPIKFPESPFVAYERFGLKISVGAITDIPKAEVLNNLMGIWQRKHGNR